MLSSISRLYQLIPIRVLLEIHRCEHADGQADHRRAGHQPEGAEDRRLRTGRRRTKLGGLVPNRAPSSRGQPSISTYASSTTRKTMPIARQVTSKARNPRSFGRGRAAACEHRLRLLRRAEVDEIGGGHSYSSRYLRTRRMLMKFMTTVMTNSSAATANSDS